MLGQGGETGRAVKQPLIDGDLRITLVGGSGGAPIVSFEKATGKELWRSLNNRGVGYSPPATFSYDGVRQLSVWHLEDRETVEFQYS